LKFERGVVREPRAERRQKRLAFFVHLVAGRRGCLGRLVGRADRLRPPPRARADRSFREDLSTDARNVSYAASGCTASDVAARSTARATEGWLDSRASSLVSDREDREPVVVDPPGESPTRRRAMPRLELGGARLVVDVPRRSLPLRPPETGVPRSISLAGASHRSTSESEESLYMGRRAEGVR
jgi:hypothetical protein